MRVGAGERGLIGKVIVLWLVLVGVVALIGIDAVSIVLARLRTDDLAQDAGFAAAERLDETGDRREAVRAALAAIARSDEDARLQDLEVSTRGEVTVVVTDRVDTLLVGRFGILDELTTVTATDTSPADVGGPGTR